LSIAVARRSGWRFILPADWITLVFYAIGFVQLIVIIQAAVKQNAERSASSEIYLPQSHPAPSYKKSLAMFGFPFFVIALGLVAGHRLFPLFYPSKSTQELLQQYQSSSYTISNGEFESLQSFLQKDGATIVYGKALYPVYFKANEGLVNFNWPSFAPQPYSRLAFYLIGPQSMSVNLPMESPPASFPDGASVIVIGCKIEAGDINALSVLVVDNTPLVYQNKPEALGSLTCTELEAE